MTTINIEGFGHNEAVNVTTTKSLVVADQGLVQNVTASAVVSLPAAAAGQSFILRVGKEGITTSLIPVGSDTMTGNAFTPAATKGAVFTNQPAGSFIQVVSGAATWHIQRLKGTATRTA